MDIEKTQVSFVDDKGPIYLDTNIVINVPEDQPNGEYCIWVKIPELEDEKLIGIFLVSDTVKLPKYGPFSIAAAFGGMLPEKIEKIEIRKREDKL